jgi:YHS domain-containing protein
MGSERFPSVYPGRVCYLSRDCSAGKCRQTDLELPQEEETVEIDPVCGMEVDPHTAAGSIEYEGETYHFCSQGCLADFTEDPESYLGTEG